MRLGGHEPDSELNIRWRAPNGRTYVLDDTPGSVSEQQIGFLQWLGMAGAHDGLSKAQASALITMLTDEAGRSQSAFDVTREALYRRRLEATSE